MLTLLSSLSVESPAENRLKERVCIYIGLVINSIQLPPPFLMHGFAGISSLHIFSLSPGSGERVGVLLLYRPNDVIQASGSAFERTDGFVSPSNVDRRKLLNRDCRQLRHEKTMGEGKFTVPNS